ncbi:unnamed protein product [Linum tenue]|uniref:Glycosylphosphatidylinositol anchor biosynthesis protein 11 n=1 Tax=Linum tenue TaxID=586396 RepID=A0AAV0JEY0_9ROSI|nr:unnamed protein product [Linum tenue]
MRKYTLPFWALAFSFYSTPVERRLPILFSSPWPSPSRQISAACPTCYPPKTSEFFQALKSFCFEDFILWCRGRRTVFLLHTICGLCLGIGLLIAHHWYSIHLVSHPSGTICLIWIIETPAALLLYSHFRRDTETYSFLRAVGRGLCAFPIGALIHAALAIVLGAPVGSWYLLKTINWSLLMSSLTIVPVASVFGSSWRDWQRVFARTEPNDLLEYMLCIPAHGAAIGAWLGAWPMPLDWERPWQEWPICVTYGAVTGYVIGLSASFCVACASTGARRSRQKGD